MEPATTRSARSLAASRRNREHDLRPTRSKHLLALHVEAFDSYMSERGMHTNVDIAAFLDLGVNTVQRAREGALIGSGFTSALLKTVGRNIFDLLTTPDHEADKAVAA